MMMSADKGEEEDKMTMWELYVKIRDMQYAIIRGEKVDEEEFEELVNRYNEMHKEGQKNI